jgi:LemA protein
MTETQLLWLVGVAITVATCALYAGLYNGVQRYLNMIPEIESNIGVLWRKREDLIGKLQGVVGSYGLHENAIAMGVSDHLGSGSVAASPSLTARLTTLRMAFPELKADGLYGNLMEQLASVETDLSSRREQYNSVVRAYNTAISEFPSNLLLRPFAFTAKPFLVEQGAVSALSPLPLSNSSNTRI